MRTDRRRLRGFFTNLVDDPYRKLMAIGLGFMLWIFIDRQITSAHDWGLSLEIIGAQGGPTQNPSSRLAVALPTDQVVGKGFFNGDERIDKVTVTLKGPKYRIDSMSEVLSLTTSFLNRDLTVGSSVEFTAADIIRDQQTRDCTIIMEPPRIRLEIERFQDWPVRLENLDLIELAADQAADRLLLNTARFNPDTAMVLGTAKEIQDLKKRTGKLFRAVIGRLPNGREVSVSLDLIADEKSGLRLQTKPTLTLQLRPQMEIFSLEVPCLVDDVALPEGQRGRYKPDKNTLPVRIQAAGELKSKLFGLRDNRDATGLAEWAADNLRLLLVVPRPEAGAALPPTPSVKPRLLILGNLRDRIDNSEFLLEEPVLVTLKLTQ